MMKIETIVGDVVLLVLQEVESLKEMGAVMAKLREDYAGQLDFGKVSGIVKERLG